MWSYTAEAGASVARFGRSGAAAELEMRCDRAARRVSLSRLGVGSSVTVRTSYGERAWPAQSAGGRATITLAAADPVLDQIAFSRGRFSVAVAGLPLLIVPAWAEPSRVIEDCRR